MNDSIKEITSELSAFSEARGWYKDGIPMLKGIAISISLEAAELLEHFQWIKDVDVENHVDAHREEISNELADVVIYALQFAKKMDIDLADAIREKMKKNAEKYPI